MNCNKCGFVNKENAKFCAKCGNNLEVKKGNVVVEFLKFLLNSIIKPFKTYDEVKEYNLKKTLIYIGITAGLVAIISLIVDIISIVTVTSYDFAVSDTVTKWVWSNVKIGWCFKALGQQILYVAVFEFVLAGVYYLAGLILKKEVDFKKVLSVSLVSLVSLFAVTCLLVPITNLITSHISSILYKVVYAYLVIVSTKLMNDNINIEENKKLYFNITCFTIAYTIVYFTSYLLYN